MPDIIYGISFITTTIFLAGVLVFAFAYTAYRNSYFDKLSAVALLPTWEKGLYYFIGYYTTFITLFIVLYHYFQAINFKGPDYNYIGTYIFAFAQLILSCCSIAVCLYLQKKHKLNRIFIATSSIAGAIYFYMVIFGLFYIRNKM